MSWMRVPTSSFLITTSVFVVFILDMASSGYGSFALISDLQPKITALTTDIRSDLDNSRGSESSPLLNVQKLDESSNCQTLLDAYKNNAKCHFNLKNY
ncbi:MAG: hypothetical protein SWZ49_21920 [Cyanobacteriota bacterium]|nr:hypothetical protein [Cyanobacteriota bacterium]